MVAKPPRPVCSTCGWPIGDTTDPAYAGCYPDQCTLPFKDSYTISVALDDHPQERARHLKLVRGR